MYGSSTRRNALRQQLKDQLGHAHAPWLRRVHKLVTSRPFYVTLIFLVGAAAIVLIGEPTLEYAVGQRIDQPIYAKIDFQVSDQKKTLENRRAAGAAVPDYYIPNTSAQTIGRIRADLTRIYQAAAGAENFEDYATAMEQLNWSASPVAYRALRSLIQLPNDAGPERFDAALENLSLDGQNVARAIPLPKEARDPLSVADHIVVEIQGLDGQVIPTKVPNTAVIPQGNEAKLRETAIEISNQWPITDMRYSVEAVVRRSLREQPTILYNQEKTTEEMKKAEEVTPVAMTKYAEGMPFIRPGILADDDYNLLTAHHDTYLEFIKRQTPRAVYRQQIGVMVLVTIMSIALFVYTHLNHPRMFVGGSRTLCFLALILGTLLLSRLLDRYWPQTAELVYGPCLLAAIILSIVTPRRYTLGAMSITAILVTLSVNEDISFLIALLTGVAVTVYLLDDIRTRTKFIASGFFTALAVMIVHASAGFMLAHADPFIARHALWAGGCALLAYLIASGALPFIERLFGIATALTLLEWRDTARPLLQLLAREAPGTYNHSLQLGTLAEAACESIGANGLLTQVGALYHDVGKIPKAEYFAENQAAGINRHDQLAPTMSLLIILGHVKDGIEMAKEYNLPRVLLQFIEEHHGTTVVRYFHQMASEKQPKIASGKHDREVSEAEFRYPGPKPHTRESAILMMCDGVEGAVRAIPEPTVGRIESAVHQVVTSRLNDGQFDECDITLKELRQVEESLVKTLSSIYHGRIAYPKSRRPQPEPVKRERISI